MVNVPPATSQSGTTPPGAPTSKPPFVSRSLPASSARANSPEASAEAANNGQPSSRNARTLARLPWRGYGIRSYGVLTTSTEPRSRCIVGRSRASGECGFGAAGTFRSPAAHPPASPPLAARLHVDSASPASARSSGHDETLGEPGRQEGVGPRRRPLQRRRLSRWSWVETAARPPVDARPPIPTAGAALAARGRSGGRSCPLDRKRRRNGHRAVFQLGYRRSRSRLGYYNW